MESGGGRYEAATTRTELPHLRHISYVRVLIVPQARRRLSVRSLSLARRNHEDERANRLTALQKAMSDLNALSEENRRVLIGQTKSIVQNLPSVPLPEEEKKEDVSQPAQPVSVVHESTSATIQSAPEVSRVAEQFSAIIENFTSNYRPWVFGRRKQSAEEVEAIEEVVKVEQETGHRIAGGESGDAAPDTATPEQADDSTLDEVIDETLQQVIPLSDFVESPSQTRLTEQEGLLLSSILRPAPVIDLTLTGNELRDDSISLPTAPELGELSEGMQVKKPASRDLTHMETLKELMERAPTLRDMFNKRLEVPTAQHHAECKELLLKMGVPILEANPPYEAEGLASSLAKAGLVDYVATEDSDVLAYEVSWGLIFAPQLMSDLQGPLLKGVSGEVRPMTFVSGGQLRQELDLTPDEYLDFCILLGTDASSRIPGIGPARAYKLIKEYGSIENLLEKNDKVSSKLDDRKGFLDMVQTARTVFKDLPPIPTDVILEQGYHDERVVEEYLEREHGIRFEWEAPPGLKGFLLESEVRSEDQVSWDVVLEDERER